MNENLSKAQFRFRLFARGKGGESMSLGGPGADPVAYKEFDRVGEALKHTRDVTEAHPYNDDAWEYSEEPAPIGEYHLHEGRLMHRIEPGTGRAIEENIRVR